MTERTRVLACDVQGCDSVPSVAWDRQSRVLCHAHTVKELDRLRDDQKRLRSENQWLRNRRNRAVELLTGDPGPWESTDG